MENEKIQQIKKICENVIAADMLYDCDAIGLAQDIINLLDGKEIEDNYGEVPKRFGKF